MGIKLMIWSKLGFCRTRGSFLDLILGLIVYFWGGGLDMLRLDRWLGGEGKGRGCYEVFDWVLTK